MKQLEDLKKAAQPVLEWLAENRRPYQSVIINEENIRAVVTTESIPLNVLGNKGELCLGDSEQSQEMMN